MCVKPAKCHAGKNVQICALNKPGGNLMCAADSPRKRAAFMTDVTLIRWSHVPASSFSVGDRLCLEPEHGTTVLNLSKRSLNFHLRNE